MEIINGIKLNVNQTEQDLLIKASKKAGLNYKKVKHFKILKKSLDARDKNNIFYVYNVELGLDSKKETEKEYPKIKNDISCLVVGAGPSGLFASLYLLRYGFKVTLIERGKSVEDRQKSLSNFIENRILDTESNVQFGEGGAGAFSDGKLNTQVGGVLIKEVLKDYVSFGAPQDIAYLSKPHIGSDNLPIVVRNARNEIIKLGGNVRFSSKLTDIKISSGKVEYVEINGKKEYYDNVILAVGHSARDVYKMLYDRNVFLEPKQFAVGYRIEHLRKNIDISQYGEKAYNLGILPSSSYKLVSHYEDRGVFTFCMCPGGYVIPSQSENNTVVVNGMSNYKRDNVNSNSAIICQTKVGDFSDDLFGGMEFQERLEKKAFILGGENYNAPTQLFKDFVDNKISSTYKSVSPSYLIGTKFANLNDLLPTNMNNSIKFAIKDMGKKLQGFDNGDSVLTGVESRTSSPIRVTRTENFNSVNVSNLYPIGEGCGYAGGIMSASIDGIKVAEKLLEKFL